MYSTGDCKMKEYNPEIDDEKVVGCPYWTYERQCSLAILMCPSTSTGCTQIPSDCPARGEGILIQVKE